MANSKLIISVEHYLDKNPRMPEAYQRFERRLDTLDQEASKWAAIVFDDVTWMELAARRYHQFHLNVKAQHPWQWFAGSTDLLELAMQIGGALPVITAFACHVGQEKDEAAGMILRAPNAPGRLAARQELLSAFSEVYKLNVTRDTEGNIIHLVQTRSDGIWVAQTHIEAPNPCDPHYECLWVNWKGERPLTKFLVYGDPGSGKSTFLASFPKPLLVFSFDPFGKEIPYLRQGQVVDAMDERGTPVRQVFSTLKKVA